MGNSQNPLKTEQNNKQMVYLSSNDNVNDFQSQNMSSECEQRENPLQNVFQKETFKKSVNQINNKHLQIRSYAKQSPNKRKSVKQLKQKPSFTQTLFDKQKIKKNSNKVIEQQFIISGVTSQCEHQKYNLEPAQGQKNEPQFKPISISQETVFKIKNIKINEKYNLQGIIGEGGFGVVYKAQCLMTHQERAIKVLQMHKYNSYEKRLILNQIILMSKVDHPNIIKIYQIIEYNKIYYIVTEYCDGGNLGDYFKLYKHAITEQIAKKIIHKLLSAMKYLHSMNIIHRDIKLQNIVIKKIVINGKEQMVIKLIDFGLAVQYHGKDMPKTEKIIGTPQYLSPESLMGVYCQKSDIWCCGIILYMLLRGLYPFRGNTKAQIISRIKKDPLNFKSAEWDGVSKDAKDLLSKMLAKNHQHRLSAIQALSHTWFQEHLKRQRAILSNICRKSSEIAQQLLNFERCNNLIRYLDNYTILTKLSEEQRQKLILYFNLIDKNHDGVIEINELKDYFINLQMKNLLTKLDQNNSQTIYLAEFIYAITNVDKYYETEYIEELFELFDTNRDGFIDQKQLKHILKECNNEEIQFLMGIICKKIKKKISFGQFERYIKSTQRRKSNFAY